MTKILVREVAAGGHAELAQIVASSHDAIVGMTAKGVVSAWNLAAARLYGYAGKDIVGRGAESLVPPELRGEESAILRRIVADEEVECYRSERVCRDGSTVTVSVTVSPIVDGAGGVVGASSSRRLSELQEARDRFEVRMGELRSQASGAAERFETLAEEVRAQARSAQERFDVQVGRERLEMHDAEDQLRVQLSTPGARVGAGQMSREMRNAHDRFESLVVEEQRAEAADAASRPRWRGLISRARLPSSASTQSSTPNVPMPPMPSTPLTGSRTRKRCVRSPIGSSPARATGC
jgi:PAS domain S-box-containing protein